MSSNPDSRSWKSILFVVLQFLCLGFIFLSGPLFADSLFLLIPELTGFAAGIWAVLVMGLGNFHVAPDPLQSGRMVRSGPYRVIRHPMYLAVLLVTLPLVLDSFSAARAGVWLILLVTLLNKMNYEEQLLQKKFSPYRAYLQNTFRLIPGLY